MSLILRASSRAFLENLVMRRGLVFEKYFFFQKNKFLQNQAYFRSSFDDDYLQLFSKFQSITYTKCFSSLLLKISTFLFTFKNNKQVTRTLFPLSVYFRPYCCRSKILKLCAFECALWSAVSTGSKHFFPLLSTGG